MKNERKSKRESRLCSNWFRRFRPRLQTRLVAVASSQRGDHDGALRLWNRWRERENRSTKASWFSGEFMSFPAFLAMNSDELGIKPLPLVMLYMFVYLEFVLGSVLEKLNFGVYGLYGLLELVVVWDNFGSFLILDQFLQLVFVKLEHEASI